jgi:hypothetical protein
MPGMVKEKTDEAPQILVTDDCKAGSRDSADEKRGAQHAVGLMGGIFDIHNHLDSSLNVAAFGADLSRLGDAGGLPKLAMNIRKKSFRDSIGCGSIHGLLLGWTRMHAPNAPEVERRVSNVIALFGLNVGVANLKDFRVVR